MAEKVNHIPQGYHTLNPDLVVDSGVKAIDFYKKAFGAKEIYSKIGPNGKFMHAALKVGDSVIMLSEGCMKDHPGHSANCPSSPTALKGRTVNFFLYVEKSDDVFKQAVAAGARQVEPVQDMFWGDRMGMVVDPFGHFWSIATHIEDPSPAEIDKRAEAFFKK